MLSSSLCVPLLTLVTYVTVVSAVPAVSAVLDLAVGVSTPNVNGLENLKVVAPVINTGGGTLKPLNDPRGVLNPSHGSTITITDPSGLSPSFGGDSANYNPTRAAGLDNPNAFTTLAPGDSVNVAHDLSAAYDFTRSGAGDYSIEPSNLFTYVDADGTPKDLRAIVTDLAKVKLTSDLAVPRRVQGKRAGTHGCSGSQREKLDAIGTLAKTHAATAYNYLEGTARAKRRYTRWFGRYNAGRKATVQSVFQNISQNVDFSTISYDCACTDHTTPAYIDPDHNQVIVICPKFWTYDDSGRTQYGVLIREVSHFATNGGTLGIVFGGIAAKWLAANDPRNAINNGDNYAFFAQDDSA